MSIDRRTCYVVNCDACRIGLEDLDEAFIPHFDSPDAANEHAAEKGWHVDIDGNLYCPRCLALARCRTDGHDLTVWMPCVCEGSHPDHALWGCGLLRYCQRDGCQHAETATLATLPTTDEPHTFGR
jgi:hypothetical protein